MARGLGRFARGRSNGSRRRRRFVYYLLAFAAAVVVYTLVYNWGMAALEGRPRSLVVVVETFTTTGYGEDAPWETLPMNLLVIAMQLTGLFFIFVTLPLFAVPWIESRLSTAAPTSADLAGHVIICA